MYRAWSERFPDWIELRAVRLPGRQGRHKEPCITHAEKAVQALLDGLAEEFETEDDAIVSPAGAGDRSGPDAGSNGSGGSDGQLGYAFFGHSMGALLAFGLTRELLRTGGRGPRLLAAASWPPHGTRPSSMPDPAASDGDFASVALGLGGVPEELAADEAMLQRTLPLLRADFELCHSYVYRPAAPLRVPVIALGGAEDRVVPPELMKTWEPESETYLGLHLFPGAHFFLQDHVSAISTLISEAVLR
jgi:surfactin synthase thioesterase subunit